MNKFTPNPSDTFKDNEDELKALESIVQQDKMEAASAQQKIINKHTKKEKPVVPQIPDIPLIEVEDDIFDFSKIKISPQTNKIEQNENIKRLLFGSQAEFQGVAVNSGYCFNITPLIKNDAIEMLYTSKPLVEYRYSVYKKIFDRITTIKLDRQISFEQWLKITALSDYENILYALYCATYPTRGRIDFTCKKCSKSFEYAINNASLVKIEDPQIQQKMMDVSKVSTIEEMKKFTTVMGRHKFVCPTTKIVVVLKPPTLFDYIDTLKNVPLVIKDIDLNAAIYIESLQIPREDGQYDELREKDDILYIYDNLNIEDSATIKKNVDGFINDNKITYSLDDVMCPQCGTEIGTVPVVLEDTLFTYLYENYLL